jgi:hypothetical protein
MLQLYFLSVSVNLLAGMILSADWLAARFSGIRSMTDGLSGRRGRLVIGMAALLVGFVTLLLPAQPPILIGDLVPSVAGLAMGVTLLFEVLRQEALFPAERVNGDPPPSHVPAGYRVPLGLFGIAAALVHFFLPERLIL